LKAKEDPIVIYRRLLIFCSEDVGPADDQAVLIISALRKGFTQTGLPEGLYSLYHAVSYLARAPKSRKHAAQIKWVADTAADEPSSVQIPKHLRNNNNVKRNGASNLPDSLSDL